MHCLGDCQHKALNCCRLFHLSRPSDLSPASADPIGVLTLLLSSILPQQQRQSRGAVQGSKLFGLKSLEIHPANVWFMPRLAAMILWEAISKPIKAVSCLVHGSDQVIVAHPIHRLGWLS